MALISAAVAFLALLSCAVAQAPAPAPVQTKTPVPVQQSAPTPAPSQEAAPAPTVSGAPPEGSPGTPAPAPTVYGLSPEGASPPMQDCHSAVFNLSDCLTYVLVGSNLTAPAKGCCPELAGLVESNPICLCQLFASSNSYGLQLDMAKALKLPSVCQISTPPLSTCALLGIPVGAPGSGEPEMAPGMSPSGTPGTAIASPPVSSKSISGFRISVTVFLIGLWAGVAVVF